MKCWLSSNENDANNKTNPLCLIIRAGSNERMSEGQVQYRFSGEVLVFYRFGTGSVVKWWFSTGSAQVLWSGFL